MHDGITLRVTSICINKNHKVTVKKRTTITEMQNRLVGQTMAYSSGMHFNKHMTELQLNIRHQA